MAGPAPEPEPAVGGDRPAAGVPTLWWTLRLRGPTLKGLPAALELPAGGYTTAAELAALAGKAAKVAKAKVVLKAGFPPRLLALASAEAGARTVEELGLRDKDVLLVERAPAATAAPAGKKAAAGKGKGKAPRPAIAPGARVRVSAKGTVFEVKKPKRQKVMRGEGRRLGDGTEAEAAEAGGDLALGSVTSAAEAAEHRMAADLVAAARGGGGGQGASAFKSLRKSLREARKQRGAEAEALQMVAAALAGEVEFSALVDGSGRVGVKYKSSARKSSYLTVPDIPIFLLKAVLLAVVKDHEGESRNNMKPSSMALVSPRVFWSVVRHGNVGPSKSFIEALHELVPGVDWEAVDQRDRQMPARFAEYETH